MTFLEKNIEKCFILFSNCQLVYGVNRGAICDLQTGKIYLVPNTLLSILDRYNKKSFTFIISVIGESNKENLKEYFEFLLEERLIYFCDFVDFFPPLNLCWDSPNIITNAIIEHSFDNQSIFCKTIQQLNSLGCKFLEIRIYYYENLLSRIEEIMAQIEFTTINSVILFIKYSIDINSDDLEEMVDNHNRITSVVLFNSPLGKSFHTRKLSTHIQSSDILLSNINCGKICKTFFNVNIELFTESLVHNTCLNRKISIDAEGNIKNCPSMKESFGNIKDTTLEEAINKPGFQKYWNIKKDEITKCKDCEFRHVCTDCRAYIDNPDDIYSAPLKCGYDPYTCTWEEWSTNPLKQKAIDYYGMRDLVNK